MAQILVVDDELHIRSAFVELLSARGHTVLPVVAAEDALAHLAAEPLDLVILDICLPGMSGLEALARIRRLRPTVPVIVMTGQGTTETAIEATKHGAFDYQLKPFETIEMLRTITKALESARLMNERVTFDPETPTTAVDAIVGRSCGMQQVYKSIGRVAETNATVLICGESGTGKELVARAIYQHSLRSQSPMLVVNCAAIPETLLESELFGYEAGAFTGAIGRRIGLFEQANGGTMFLDEIGDIPLPVQAKILRLLQEMSFQRLGGNQTINVDVRVLCATHRDLEQAIVAETFREDLYHRLNVVTIHVPPLRERPEDIPELVDYFLTRYCRELNIGMPSVTSEVIEQLQNYAWPGNVRQLQHLIERVLIFTRGYSLQVDDIRLALEQEIAPAPKGFSRDDAAWLNLVCGYLSAHAGARAHEQLLEKVESLLLAEALRRSGNNQTHAARMLGLARVTLHDKLKKYGLGGLGDVE